MRFAYADPPYIGQGKRYEAQKEVNHPLLIANLAGGGYDGWALSCHTPSLPILLPLCPAGTRVAAWCKPWVPFKPHVHAAYAWEPVLWWGGRKHEKKDRTQRDYLVQGSQQKGFHGSKPDGFCFWLFAMWNVRRGDEIEDVFPGTGRVTRAWEKYQLVARPVIE